MSSGTKSSAEPVPSPAEVDALRQEVAGLKQTVAKLTETNQKIVKVTDREIADGKQKVALLENALEAKQHAVNGAAMTKELKEELDKKVTDQAEEIETLKLAIIGARSENKERMDELEEKLRNVTGELEEEQLGRVKDQKRIAELMQQLQQLQMQHRSAATPKSSASQQQTQPADTPKTVEVDTRRRSSRIVPKSQAESAVDSDEETQPPVKKSRSDSAKRDGKKTTKKDMAQSGQHLNDTDLECPECEYRSRSVQGWCLHLRSSHSTSPLLAGRALLCKCGNESFSNHHKLTCSVAKFTVIRKNNGPIQRFDDKKTTPQCVLCEEYPKTAYGYTYHLMDYHNSTLIANGIFLRCDCGEEFRSRQFKPDHAKKCNGRQFTLHKLNEE